MGRGYGRNSTYPCLVSHCRNCDCFDECLADFVFVANIGDAYPTSTTITITNSGAKVLNESGLLSFGTIAGTGKKVSSTMNIGISRLGSNAYDVYDDVIGLISADIHYKVNSLGSNNETSK